MYPSRITISDCSGRPESLASLLKKIVIKREIPMLCAKSIKAEVYRTDGEWQLIPD